MDALDVAALAETLSALRSADDSTADSGGVQSVPTGPHADLDAGGAAGVFGDMAAHFASKARALMNLTTYYTMKARAAVVGETGVAPVLSQVEDTRVHLVGHSFGARLVTSAAQQLAVTNQLRSISLLQAAFSHYSFSAAWSPGHAGFFRKVVDPGRVAGPMIITHTRHDTAVGIAYAMASALAQQVAAEVGGPDSLYGGLGSNGAQKTAEARNDQDLGPVDTDYDFHDRAVYNLLADRFVSSHSDVRGPEVAHAVLRAVAASE
jgi:pimeloyl-ACP methyl ester carboxylesterase